MTIDLEGMMTSLNAQRAAVDGAFLAILSTMSLWLDMLQEPAQKLAFWITIMVAVGRGVLFAFDLVDRVRRRSKSFPGERFGRPPEA